MSSHIVRLAGSILSRPRASAPLYRATCVHKNGLCSRYIPVATKTSNAAQSKGVQSGKAGIAEAPAVPIPATKRSSTIKWATTKLQLGGFEPRKMDPANVGEVLQLPDAVVTAAESGLFPESLARQGLSTLMLRQSTLDLVAAVKKECEQPTSRHVIALDGPRGVGKSVSLLQMVSHFKSEGWIVLYLPQTTQWVNGTEPFDPVPGTSSFNQPSVAARVLHQLLTGNGDLSQIKAEGGGSIASLAATGLNQPERAQQCLDTILDTLANVKDRAPVLIAIDQVNTFYSITAYHDVESRVVTANQLSVVNSFLKFLNQERPLPKGVILCAVDRSDTQYFSPILNHLLAAAQSISPTSSNPGPVAAADRKVKYHDVASVDSFGVLLPESLAPASYDPLAPLQQIHPKNLARFDIPTYDKYEVACMLKFYKESANIKTFLAEQEQCRRKAEAEEKAGNEKAKSWEERGAHIPIAKPVRITRDDVEKELVLSGGNALKLYKRCLLL